MPTDHASSHCTEVLQPVCFLTGQEGHHEPVGGGPHDDGGGIAAARPAATVLYDAVQAQEAAACPSEDDGVGLVLKGVEPPPTDAFDGTIDGTAVQIGMVC